MWVVYILYSKKKNITYTGSTNNFQRRLAEHNDNKVFTTKNFGPWMPIYIEFYKNEPTARKREKELKTSAGRRYLVKVIDNIIKDWTISSVG